MSRQFTGRGSKQNSVDLYVERYTVQTVDNMDSRVFDRLEGPFRATRRPLGLATSSIVPEGERVRKEWRALSTTRLSIGPKDILRDRYGVRYQITALNVYPSYIKMNLRQT